jgi:hypothetical protein
MRSMMFHQKKRNESLMILSLKMINRDLYSLDKCLPNMVQTQAFNLLVWDLDITWFFLKF